LDGTGLRFETMEHGGKYPDTMSQAIKLIDAEGSSCIYEPDAREHPARCDPAPPQNADLETGGGVERRGGTRRLST
jgi:hypothetical protein